MTASMPYNKILKMNLRLWGNTELKKLFHIHEEFDHFSKTTLIYHLSKTRSFIFTSHTVLVYPVATWTHFQIICYWQFPFCLVIFYMCEMDQSWTWIETTNITYDLEKWGWGWCKQLERQGTRKWMLSM